MNETLYNSLAHAREALSFWKGDHNTVRPHSGLGGFTPAAYADRSTPRNGTGRCATLRAPRPVPLLDRAKWVQPKMGLCSLLDERRGSGQHPSFLRHNPALR
ncbi:transposase [Bradyrhizobium sp. 18]|nr:transposase [Bradyrhizobium sp. 18]